MFFSLSTVSLHADTVTTVFKTANVEGIFCQWDEPEGVPYIEVTNSLGTYQISIDNYSYEHFLILPIKQIQYVPIMFDIAVVVTNVEYNNTSFTEVIASNIRVMGNPNPNACKK
jgi:hypothetical protein